MHCKPISQTPPVAQTVLQVKLEAILGVIQNSGGVVTNLFGVLPGIITNVTEAISNAMRAIPWKV